MESLSIGDGRKGITLGNYIRKISYIHLYNDDREGRGVGFVKLDVRNGVFRITAQLKGIYTNGDEGCKVYSLLHGGEKHSACLLDEFLVKNGAGEYRASYSERDRLPDGSAPGDITGLVFLMEPGRVAAAVWDRQGVYSKERFMDLIGEVDSEPGGEEDVKPAGGSSGDAAENGAPAPAGDNVGRTENGAPAPAGGDVGRAENGASAPAGDNVGRAENGAPAPAGGDAEESMSGATAATGGDAMRASADASVRESSRMSAENGHAPGIRQESVGGRETENRDDGDGDAPAKSRDLPVKWVQIRNSFPLVRPFEYDTGTEYVNISVKDLTLLDRKYWVLGNNSFLLHNFYNFRYLILGRRKEGDAYVLGVPGIYHEREQMMAEMFGFGDFQSSAKETKEPGCFGYYMKNVRI